jgi:hypothetical protein
MSVPDARDGREVLPQRVFGEKGRPVQLAGRTYHLAVHTVAGIRAFKRFLEEEFPAGALVDADSAGQAVVDGALLTDNFGPLRRLLEMAIEEELPEGVELHATATELREALDAFFAQNGFAWMERLVKNSAALATRLLEAHLAERLTAVTAVAGSPATPAAAQAASSDGGGRSSGRASSGTAPRSISSTT